MKSVDVAIIGAGTAGLAARSEVAKVTHDYVVIEKGALGTTCARTGCMPSKALVQVANAFHRRLRYDAMGIRGAEHLRVDGVAVMHEVRRLRDYFVSHVARSMETWAPDHLLRGEAEFDADGSLRVDGERIRARRIVVATGTRPVVPKAFAELGDALLTTDDLFELRDLPRSIAVAGTGAIGIELGQALSRLGVEVVACDPSPAVGGLSDPEIQDAAHALLGREFEWIRQELQPAREGEGVRVEAGGRSFRARHLLASVGRRADLRGLGLEALGVNLEDGVPAVEPTTQRVIGTDVYLAGDAYGRLPVLHEANDSGRIAGYNAARSDDTSFEQRTRMLVTFCDPQIAVVGDSFESLNDRSAGFVTGRATFDDQGRARLAHNLGGRVHVYVDEADGRLLGAEMVAPAAEHFAHELVRGITSRLSVHDVLAMPFYHPTYEEGLRSALRDAANQLPHADTALGSVRCESAAVG